MIVLADFLRIVAALLYVTILGLSIYTVAVYYQAWSREKSIGWVGLLPRHVYLIGISYILYATGSVVWAAAYWGETLTPFTVLNVVAGAIGTYALKILLDYDKKQYR